VWIILMHHCRPDRLECWPAIERIQVLTDFSRSKVRKCLAELERTGFITRRKEKHRRTMTYEMNLPKGRILCLPNWLILHPVATSRQKMVVATIVRHTNRRKGTRQWAQVKLCVIQEKLGLSKRQVQYDLEAVIEGAILERERPDQFKPTQYSLLPIYDQMVPDPLIVSTWPNGGEGAKGMWARTHKAGGVTAAGRDSLRKEAMRFDPDEGDREWRSGNGRDEKSRHSGASRMREAHRSARDFSDEETCSVCVDVQRRFQLGNEESARWQAEPTPQRRFSSIKEERSSLSDLLQQEGLKPLKQWPEHLQEFFEERAGYREFHCCEDHDKAEKNALKDVLQKAKEEGQLHEILDNSKDPRLV